MGKLIDYLEWRGDLCFSKDPLNDIDSLILSLITYLPFKGIVPGIESNREILLNEAAYQFFAKFFTADGKILNFYATASSSFDSEVAALFKKAASCPRFKDIRLSKYEDNLDLVAGRQFAALTFTLNNIEREKVITCRGTDSSLVGWKEDFELAYMEKTPAQESACAYLDRTIGLFSSQFTVCGHSKGGNLALYAGTHFNTYRQNRLKRIINFDGPGFDFSIVQKKPFLQHEHKIINYIPEESMVGLLLESVGERVVVSSTDRYIFQHNAINWEIERTQFARGNLSNNAKQIDQTLKSWLPDISRSEREMFLNALFEILGVSDGNAIRLNPHESVIEIKYILRKYSKMDKKTKALLGKIFKSLSSKTKSTFAASAKVKNTPARIMGEDAN